MAHHLAEVMARADAATGPEKAKAETQAADLIVRLWANRRSLPASAEPLGGYREAIEVLSRLMPDRNPWATYAGRSAQDGMLSDLFECMANIVVGGLLLTLSRAPREVSPAEAAALEKEELALCEHLSWWERAVRPSLPDTVRVTFVPATGSGDEMQETQGAAVERATPTEELAVVPGGEIDCGRRNTMIESLEHMRSDFDKLIARWRAGEKKDEVE